MEKLRRKIDKYLMDWKNSKDRMPLIIKGAQQVGKSTAVEIFAENNYEHFVKVNFSLQPQYKSIFDDGYDVDTIIRNMSLINPNFVFESGKTLIFFDELQDCINAATSLKSFNLDGRFDVICSGSMMGINYNEIESNSVGNKVDYDMYSLDFEEFLWAKGYSDDQIEQLYSYMIKGEPLPQIMYDVMLENFQEFMIVGGMPRIVMKFITEKNYSGILEMQRQILRDYEEDITKYAQGMDKTRILNSYNKIAVFLGNENKKFQISKIAKNSRSREYLGTIEWLNNAGIINVCYCLMQPELPLKGNYSPDNYKVYFRDTGLLIASLDEEAQEDLRYNKNFNTYKGALYENIVADMLVKSGYSLYFYKNEKSTLEMDFFVRDVNSLVPVEVKASDNSTVSLSKLVTGAKYKDIKYGIKLGNKNIGFNGKFYTFPYFLTFLLKRYLKEKKEQ